MKVSASVYMTLQVEVYVGDWEASQPFDALHNQAQREAREKLLGTFPAGGGIEILTVPAVMHVVTKEKK